MAIKRYYADADNTITNAYDSSLVTRGTGSNMGQADILEVFSIYGQQSSTSSELSRILIKFPIADISADRSANQIPALNKVSFYLKLYNAEHSKTLAKNFKLTIQPISGSWEEGDGLDMEEYTDITNDHTGSNWINARTGEHLWTTQGGDYWSDDDVTYNKSFPVGTEDLEVDITTLVEQWIAGTKDNHGVGIRLSASYEAYSNDNTLGAKKSYYTKKFFARSSEFFFKRPVIEARWNSSRRDDRENFYFSSSLAPGPENINTLYLYNYIRGRLRDIGGNPSLVPVMRLYYSSGSLPEGNAIGFKNTSNTTVTEISASRQEQGVYYAQFAVTSSVTNSTYQYLHDVWSLGDDVIHTGSAISPKKFKFNNYNPDTSYVLSMINLKKKYTRNQTERFRLYVREKNWSPNIYSKAKMTPDTLMVQSASYQISRISDSKIVIPYNTGSDNATMLSYDKNGNYFDLDMDLLEGGYSYGIRFSFYEDSISSYREQPYLFKFRVEKDEY